MDSFDNSTLHFSKLNVSKHSVHHRSFGQIHKVRLEAESDLLDMKAHVFMKDLKHSGNLFIY